MTWYKTFPRTVEAYQFLGGAAEPGWPEGWLEMPHVFERGGRTLVIKHKDGDRRAKKGDFVVKDLMEHPGNRFSTEKPGIFLGTHEETRGEE